MINKYKLRSVSVSVTDEDNLEFRNKIESTFAEKQLSKKFIITPENAFLKFWEISIMILVMWQAIYVPTVLAFEPIIPYSLWSFDKAVDIMFIVDFILQFNIARRSSKGSRLPANRKEIAKAYVTSSHGMWFLIDLSASFPYDWVTQKMTDVWSYEFYIETMKGASGGAGVSGGIRIVKILRLPRLLRLLKLFRIFSQFRRFEKFQRFLKYSRYGHLLRLFTKVIQIVILCHYGACIWFAIGGPGGGGMWFQYECINIANHCDDFFKYNTTASQLECYDSCDYENMSDYDVGKKFWTLYVTSYFAIIAMMTAGENLSPISISEKLMAVVFILTGSIVMAIVFGEVAVLISNFYARQSRYQTKMEYLFESMKRMGLPAEIERRVYSYYDYIHEAHGTLNGETTAFIPELSKKLAAEVLMYLRMDMIHKVPFFQNISPEVVQQLVLKLTLQVFLPKEYICVRGEVGDEMFFISDGDCEVTIPYKDMPQSKKDEMMRERLKARLTKHGTASSKNLGGFLKSVRNGADPLFRRKSGHADSLAGGKGQRRNSGDDRRSYREGAGKAPTRAALMKNAKGSASTRDFQTANKMDLNAPEFRKISSPNLPNQPDDKEAQNSINRDSNSGENESRKASFVSFLRGQTHKKSLAPGKDEDEGEPDPDKEMILATLHKGSHFGEIALILLTKRTANVRAKGFCELCGLTREVYNNIVAIYIEDKKAMEDYIMSKYGNSENVQEQYRKEQEKIANAQFGMHEGDDDDDDDDDDVSTTTPMGTPKRRGKGAQILKQNSYVLKEIKEQTGSMTDSVNEGIKIMNEKMEQMMSLQSDNRRRTEGLNSLVAKLREERLAREQERAEKESAEIEAAAVSKISAEVEKKGEEEMEVEGTDGGTGTASPTQEEDQK